MLASLSRFGKAWGLSLVPLALVLPFIRWRNPAFFFIDDKQAQYSATFHYIGKELLAGRLPVLVPGQGTAANLLLDAQYGLANPIYWLQNIAFAQFDDLLLATWLMAGVYLAILAGGTAAWALRLGAAPAWAAVAGGAASLSGFTLYVAAATWHPALASLAFLPWFGWALAARRLGGLQVLAIIATSFAVFGGGWPFHAVAGGLVLLGSVIEHALRSEYRGAILRVLAGGAGALLAAPTMLFLAAVFDWSIRSDTVKNAAFLVPNLADVLNTALATAGANMNYYAGGVTTRVPLMLAGGLGLSLACFIDWRRFKLSNRGYVTLLFALLAVLLATQSPSSMGPLRDPFRMLAPWQVLLPLLLVVVLSTTGVVVTRRRIVGGSAILVVGLLLALARNPDRVGVQVVSLVIAGVLLAALITQRLPLALALIGLTGVWAVAVMPANVMFANWGMPTAVENYRPLGQGQILALYPRTDTKSFARQGVYLGQNFLYTDVRSGVGYSPVNQRYLKSKMCQGIWGETCPEVTGFLTSTESQTGEQWLGLLGPATVVAHRDRAESLLNDVVGDWRRTDETADFIVLESATAANRPGRITFVSGGTGQASEVATSATSQSYRFDRATDGKSRLVVFSDVYWPGYRASWNDQEIPAFALDNSLVAVEVPGEAGALDVTYRPAGLTAALISVGLGLIMAVGAMLQAVRRPR